MISGASPDVAPISAEGSGGKASTFSLPNASRAPRFLTTNAAHTAAALDRLIALLGRFRALLVAGDEAGLTKLMEEAKDLRAKLEEGR